MNKNCSLGVLFRREHPPELLPEFSRRVEAAGFDELWVVEDCFFGSGIAAAAMALAENRAIPVGLGIMSVVVRNPVFSAMEIATLARLHPGRFLPGGMAGWMQQIGAMPESQLKALAEVTQTVKQLLRGQNLSVQGDYVQLDQVQLVHPPAQVPPLQLGVRSQTSLSIAGQIADGTIVAEYAAPSYIQWALRQIESGRRAAGRDSDHRLTVFALACTDSEEVSARDQLRPLIARAIASGNQGAMQLKPLEFLPKAQDYLEKGGLTLLESEMPDAWIDQLAIAETSSEWQAAISRLVAAGANSTVLVPIPCKSLDEIERFAGNLDT